MGNLVLSINKKNPQMIQLITPEGQEVKILVKEAGKDKRYVRVVINGPKEIRINRVDENTIE